MANQIDLANWMSQLDPSKNLVDICIPGSHDSSTYFGPDRVLTNLGFTKLTPSSLGAVTQTGSYTDQLNAGIRYFDVRTQWFGDHLKLHHSIVPFELFEDVLKNQIKPFVDAHPGELIFLDIDLKDPDFAALHIINPGTHADNYVADQAAEVLRLLKLYIPEDMIATAHLNSDGTFNKNVTWGNLVGKQFIITWSYKDTLNTPWLSFNENIRYSDYDNFEDHDLDWILNFLTQKLTAWQKDKLYISQVVDTPKNSLHNSPALIDGAHYQEMNDWIKNTGNKVNIVLRDFVNSDYNKNTISGIINLNSFIGMTAMGGYTYSTSLSHPVTPITLPAGTNITTVEAAVAYANSNSDVSFFVQFASGSFEFFSGGVYLMDAPGYLTYVKNGQKIQIDPA